MDKSVHSYQAVTDAGANVAASHPPFLPFGLSAQEALAYRKQLRGMIGVASKVPLKDRSVLSLLYTPGVAASCVEIAKEPLTSFDYTMRGNTIALVTDGSSALAWAISAPWRPCPCSKMPAFSSRRLVAWMLFRSVSPPRTWKRSLRRVWRSGRPLAASA